VIRKPLLCTLPYSTWLPPPSAQLQVRELDRERGARADVADVPHNELAVDAGRAHMGHGARRAGVRAHVRDRVLVDGAERGLAAGRGARRAAALVRVLERVERRAVQPAHDARAPCAACAAAPCAGVVERARRRPAADLPAREQDWLAVVARDDKRVLGRPREGDEGERVDLDRLDRRPARVNDRDTAVVACVKLSTAPRADRRKGDALTNARMSPEGENPTECTQPPDGLPYSPQTVLKGSFSPHTDAAGLQSVSAAIHGAISRRLLLVHILDVRREDTRLHVSTSRRQQDIVRVPVDGEHGGAERLLEQAGDPPVVLRVE
jgi:hypothetical protein